MNPALPGDPHEVAAEYIALLMIRGAGQGQAVNVDRVAHITGLDVMHVNSLRRCDLDAILARRAHLDRHTRGAAA